MTHTVQSRAEYCVRKSEILLYKVSITNMLHDLFQEHFFFQDRKLKFSSSQNFSSFRQLFFPRGVTNRDVLLFATIQINLCSELTLILYGRSRQGFHLFEPWLSQQLEFLHSHTCSKKTWWSSAPPCNWLCEYVEQYCSQYISGQ